MATSLSSDPEFYRFYDKLLSLIAVQAEREKLEIADNDPEWEEKRTRINERRNEDIRKLRHYYLEKKKIWCADCEFELEHEMRILYGEEWPQCQKQ